MECQDRDNNTNLFNVFDIVSKQNNRYLICGPSGSGKTHIQFQLIFFELPKYKRHIYIYGGKDKLKETLLPQFKNYGINVIELPINSGTELEKLNFEALGRNDLLIIDDLSHILSQRDNELIKFLNKAYTCSRQRGFDIITILHKLKLNNKMLRDNCTKIIITGINKEILDEFGEYIINPTALPIILDCNDNMKQKFLDLSQFNEVKGLGVASKILDRIKIPNTESFPLLVRKNKKPIFINVETKDEKFQYKVPEGYIKAINGLKNSKKGFINNIDIPILNEAINQRETVNSGELKAGNSNINKNSSKNSRLTMHKTKK